MAGEPELERDWRTAGFVGNWNLYLSAEEAEAFTRGLLGLVRDASRQPAERAPDARRVLLSYRLLPWVE